MIKTKYPIKEIKAFLSSYSDIDKFYLTRIGGPETSVVSYFDDNWKASCLMIDDEVLFQDCITFLETSGNPVICGIEEIKEFERKVKEKQCIDLQ